MEVKDKPEQPPLPARFGQQLGVMATLYRAVMERLLAPHDLTWGQFALLLHLARRGAPNRISDIALAIDVTQPAVTKVVQKFQSLGWVDIQRDRQDARNRLVGITAQGLARVGAIQQSFGPVFQGLLTDWPVADIERMTQDLTRLTARLAEINDTLRKRDDGA